MSSTDTTINHKDMERLTVFMRTMDEAGIERHYVARYGYDFALAACRARVELGMPSTLQVLTHAMQVLTMEDAAKMLEMGIEQLRVSL